VVIATGAALEIDRMRRGGSLIPLRQFRLRMVSAIVWMILLGATGYAVIFLWPQPHDVVTIRLFLRIMVGVLLLLIIGLLLLLYDVIQVGQERRLQEAHFNEQLSAMAYDEIQRAQGHRAKTEAPPPSETPNSSPTGGTAQ
jgi:ABC-type multidrug transport system fused ATPase/permease subunit